MSQPIEVRVPDIGDFQDVEVIEVLVAPGDAVAENQSLITLVTCHPRWGSSERLIVHGLLSESRPASAGPPELEGF